MAKRLFELLVVEGQLKAQAQACRSDLRATFEKKRHLFEEKRKTFSSVEEGVPPVVEEQSDIQSGVMRELRWMAEIWSKTMDTSFAIAHGNRVAQADVVLDDGTVLLIDVPATALLELEKRAGELMELLLAVPTLDPAKGFREDPEKGQGVYKAREVTKARTQKVQQALVLYPATPEHPAQTQLVSLDHKIGTIIEQEWSSLISPAEKATLISRCEEMRRAFKAALHRANAVQLAGEPVCAAKVFSFVLDGRR